MTETPPSSKSAMQRVSDRFHNLSVASKIAVLTIPIVSLALFGVALSALTNQSSGDTAKKTAAELTYKTVTATEAIGFGTETKEDANRWEDEKEITQAGVDGVAKRTYKLFSDGTKKEISRKVIKESITEITAVGTKQKPITDMAWEELRVFQFERAPLGEKTAVADKYLSERGLKQPGLPGQDPKWLVDKLAQWSAENTKYAADYAYKNLKSMLDTLVGMWIADWQTENYEANLNSLSYGASIDHVKALLGEPSDTQHNEMQGLPVVDYLYYGSGSNRDQLVFENGRLRSKNRY